MELVGLTTDDLPLPVLDVTAALAHASGLDDYAAQMRSHAQTFASGIRGLSF